MSNMNEFDIALVVVVRQRGADAGDAADRALYNMRIAPQNTFDRPPPFEHTADAGPATVVRHYVAMISEKSPPGSGS